MTGCRYAIVTIPLRLDHVVRGQIHQEYSRLLNACLLRRQSHQQMKRNDQFI